MSDFTSIGPFGAVYFGGRYHAPRGVYYSIVVDPVTGEIRYEVTDEPALEGRYALVK